VPLDTTGALAHINDVLRRVSAKIDPSGASWENMGPTARAELETLMHSTIDRWAPSPSVYRDRLEAVLEANGEFHLDNLPALRGILLTMKYDFEHGYLDRVSDLVHAELFDDFLEMADHLLAQGYKDQAIVTAGGVLEQHLRKLSLRAGLDIHEPDGVHYKKAASLNDELHGSGAYKTRADQKLVLGWLGIRNDPGHGNWAQYSPEQVTSMVSGIREFIVRHPA
jgi:hypothetical protein